MDIYYPIIAKADVGKNRRIHAIESKKLRAGHAYKKKASFSQQYRTYRL